MAQDGAFVALGQPLSMQVLEPFAVVDPDGRHQADRAGAREGCQAEPRVGATCKGGGQLHEPLREWRRAHQVVNVVAENLGGLAWRLDQAADLLQRQPVAVDFPVQW
ncbi:hypothetical protein D3C85_627720 [compost metagenome]